MEKLAPIVLFVFTRLEHTIATVDALKKNNLALDSDLIIFSDSERNLKEKKLVDAVRNYIKTISGFKSVTIVYRAVNFGLATNIINGISDVLSTYDKAIILEDDIVTSEFFLEFMNRALVAYENNERVWHISGWNYPIDARGLEESFFLQAMNCWGWATWSKKWDFFEKKPELLVSEWGIKKRWKFNLNNSYNFWSQVKRNNNGDINTWAVFWYATIFKHQGLCLNPTKSLVYNSGNDGSGENCGNDDRFLIEEVDTLPQSPKLPQAVIECKKARKRIISFNRSLKGKLISRVLFKIRGLIYGS